jgi:hypothetical protein
VKTLVALAGVRFLAGGAMADVGPGASPEF